MRKYMYAKVYANPYATKRICLSIYLKSFTQIAAFYVLRTKDVRPPSQKRTSLQWKTYVFGTENIKPSYLHKEIISPSCRSQNKIVTLS